MTPLEVYEAALRRAGDGAQAPLLAVTDCGQSRSFDVSRWCAGAIDGDAGIVARCIGPTIDLGCGPGRLAAAVSARGIPALGVDVSPVAVRLSHARGALALRRNVFDRLPGERRWAHVLLADGNIGNGGDPVRLLRRCRELLADHGTVLVETDPAGAVTGPVRLLLPGASTPLPWAYVAADALPDYGSASGLRTTESWREADRWFTLLCAA